MPIYIVGAGIAGLFAALKLAPRPVVVVSPSPIAGGIMPAPVASASSWAQGGIAAAIGPDDSPALHIADTLAAGAGLCDEAAVRLICESAPARIWDLIALGVPFDRDERGALSLGLEAAHSRHRIARIQGDRAGAAIMRQLAHAVQQSAHITLRDHHEALSLSTDARGHINGICLADRTAGTQSWLPASTVILATGGIGALYGVTTNPAGAYGSGIALALDAGAALRDMEFVQFHPTALLLNADPAPLATEALRGEGAILVNDAGERFMPSIHPQAELAPRDVVARAIHRQIVAGRKAYLDARAAIGESFAMRFPTVFAACQKAGIDAAHDLLPVSPAAHYHIGGVATDLMGRTSVPGLYACGETACTGAHGANRLASNSLLESLVFAHTAAMDILGNPEPARAREALSERMFNTNKIDALPQRQQLRDAMTLHAGIEREAAGLQQAEELAQSLSEDENLPHRLRQMGRVAAHVAEAAHARTRSVGCHFRSDEAPEATKIA